MSGVLVYILTRLTSGEPYPDTDEEAKKQIRAFGISWLGTLLAMAVIVVYLANVHALYGDANCVQSPRKVKISHPLTGKRLFIEIHLC